MLELVDGTHVGVSSRNVGRGQAKNWAAAGSTGRGQGRSQSEMTCVAQPKQPKLGTNGPYTKIDSHYRRHAERSARLPSTQAPL